MTTSADDVLEATRAQLRANGFSEDDIRRYEENEARAALRRERFDRAVGLIEPLMLASLEDRRYFDALAPDVRAGVTLWVLSVQVHRNGLFYFLEDDPEWLVKAAPDAAAALGHAELSRELAAIVPGLPRRRGAGPRLSARSLDPAAAERVERLVMDRSFDAGVVEHVLGDSHERFVGEQEPANAIRRAVEARRASQAASLAEARARTWDELQSRAVPWSRDVRFAVGDAVHHPKFGVGRVLALVGPDKIDVEFADSRRTLVHAAS